jgi:hypothetical protein
VDGEGIILTRSQGKQQHRINSFSVPKLFLSWINLNAATKVSPQFSYPMLESAKIRRNHPFVLVGIRKCSCEPAHGLPCPFLSQVVTKSVSCASERVKFGRSFCHKFQSTSSGFWVALGILELSVTSSDAVCGIPISLVDGVSAVSSVTRAGRRTRPPAFRDLRPRRFKD